MELFFITHTMPRFPLTIPDYTPYSITTTHLWHAVGRSLYRREFATNVDEFVHDFSKNISRLDANENICLVVFENPPDFGWTLWACAPTWKVIARKATSWILTPNRVVCKHMHRIVAYSFSGASNYIATGYMMGASDKHVIYDDDVSRKWEDGSPARPGEMLRDDDTTFIQGETHDRTRGPYWFTGL